MTKRDIFADLMEGFDALGGARQGKMTLKTTEVAIKPPPEMTPEKVRAVREKLQVSEWARRLERVGRTCPPYDKPQTVSV